MPDIRLLSGTYGNTAEADRLRYESAVAARMAEEVKRKQYALLAQEAQKAREDAATEVERGRPEAVQVGREGYLAERIREADLLTNGIPKFGQTVIPSEPVPESWAPGQMSRVDPQALFTAQNAAVDKMSAVPGPGQSTSGAVENSRSVKETSKAGAGTPMQGLLSDRVAELMVKGVTPDYFSEKVASKLADSRLSNLGASENPALLNELFTKEIGSYADPAAAQRKAESDLAIKQIQYGSGLLGKMEQSKATVDAAKARGTASESVAKIKSASAEGIAKMKNSTELFDILRKADNDVMDYTAQLHGQTMRLIDPMMATITMGQNGQLIPYMNQAVQITNGLRSRAQALSAGNSALVNAMGAGDTQGQATSMNFRTDLAKKGVTDTALQYSALMEKAGAWEKVLPAVMSLFQSGQPEQAKALMDYVETLGTDSLPSQTSTDLRGSGEATVVKKKEKKSTPAKAGAEPVNADKVF